MSSILFIMFFVFHHSVYKLKRSNENMTTKTLKYKANLLNLNGEVMHENNNPDPRRAFKCVNELCKIAYE